MNRPPEGNEVAQWLVEAARRARLDGNPAPAAQPIDGATVRRTFTPTVRRCALTGVAALAFLQYYYFHVMVEISKLPTLVVFVPSAIGSS
jgi:hypothetical protein